MVRVGDAEELAYAGEIGLRGAYVAIPRPRPRRQLLTLTLALPEGGEMDVHCMVVRAVTADEARVRGIPPGMAVQFYGLSKQAGEQWEKIFFRVLTGRCPRTSPEPKPGDPSELAPKPPSLVIVPEEEDPFREDAELPPRAPSRPSGSHDSAEWGSWFDYFLGEAASREPGTDEAGSSEEPAPAPVGDASERAEAPDAVVGPVLYRFALPSVPALRAFAGNALSARGIFVRTDDARPPGTPAVVSVVHPDSGDELHLPGEVVEVSTERQGVAVAFDGITARTISDVLAFAGESHDEESAPGLAAGALEVETLAHTTRPRPSSPDEAMENAEDVSPSALMVLTSSIREGGSSEDLEELSLADLIEVDET